MLRGVCSICGKVATLINCKLCGALVCLECSKDFICIRCRSKKNND